MPQTFKRRINLLLFFAIFILTTTFMSFLIFIYYESHHKSITIETKLGKIIGTSVKRMGKRVECFFGIPYAEAPVGHLRFKKPVPKKSWKEPLKATKQPHYCWQKQFQNNKNPKILEYIPDWEHFFDTTVSEDCLHLNIFVPNTDRSAPNLTVMVWIHGGSFQTGSISSTNFDGSTLAASSDVIVVAINYRLGVFGFLSAEGTELTGNYGLHDQVMAFQWIKSNIQSFGGNPNNVVLFGESAGAISVGYHLISPLSENLFSRAILQSGNAVVPIIMAGKQLQTNAVIDMIRNSFCWTQLSENSSNILDKSGILCLRQLNASLLFDLSQQVSSQRIGAFLPIEGNDFFAEHPQDLVRKKRFFSNKEILIGTNSVEGASFSQFGPFRKFWFDNKIDSNFTKQTIVETLNQSLPEEYKGLMETAVIYALEGVTNDTDYVEVWNRYVKIVGDIIFVCSDFAFISAYSSSNRSVYYYQFKPKTTFRSWGPTWATGAVHSEEIPFVFGIPVILQKFYTLKEIELSKTIMNSWTHFAKTGKPSSCDSWLPYRCDEPLYMSFDVNDVHMNQGFPGFKCSEYYDAMINETRKYMRSGNKVPL